MDLAYHALYTGYTNPNTDRSHMRDGQGRFRTNIFLEMNPKNPLYTMRELPFKGLPSAYLIYMLSDSEYEAAMKLVGSWNHWQRMCEIKPFMEGPRANKNKGNTWAWAGLSEWRLEKEIRDKATAYNQLKINAEEGNVQAQKLIFEGGAGKRGRPSQVDIQKAAEKQAAYARSIKDDLNRIKLVKNGRKATGN